MNIFRNKAKVKAEPEEEETTTIVASNVPKKGQPVAQKPAEKTPEPTEDEKQVIVAIEEFKGRYESVFNADDMLRQHPAVIHAMVCNLLFGLYAETKKLREAIERLQ